MAQHHDGDLHIDHVENNRVLIRRKNHPPSQISDSPEDLSQKQIANILIKGGQLLCLPKRELFD